MCGRARCTLRADDISRACGINDGPIRSVQMDSYRPSYNVSPGMYMPVVRREDAGGEGAVLHCLKWGLVPSFTKKTEKPDHFKMFNARSESINEKASFRRLVPNNRCLVAVEGFYEWKKDGSRKQPYYIHFKDERPLVFAALYDSWKNSEGEVLYTFTILTTSSSSSLQWLHDRMPVILGGKGATDAWLIGSVPKLGSMLRPYEDPDLVWYPVTPAMGKTSFNGPECIKEIQLKLEENNSISKFFTKKKTENQEESAKMSLFENVKDEPGNQEESAKMILLENVKDECSNQEESGKMSLLENVKDEPENQESAKMSLVENIKDEQGNQEEAEDTTDSKVSKADVSFLVPDKAGKCGIKREYEECAANMKSTINKLETSHAKKKANLKSAGDKQSTLFSYFSKS